MPKVPFPQASNDWGHFTTQAEVIARAGGRRRYNSQRHFEANLRRVEVLRLLGEYGLGRGARAKIARELGVHRSTVTRDVQATLFPHRRRCPRCRTSLTDRAWRQLGEETEHPEIDPLSAEVQAEAVTREAIAAVLPEVLDDLGFFDDERPLDADGEPVGQRVVLADLVDNVTTKVARKDEDNDDTAC